MLVCMYAHRHIYVEVYEHSTKWATGGFSFFPNTIGDKLGRMNGIKAFLSSLIEKGNLLPALLMIFENPQKNTGVHMNCRGNCFCGARG